jgi:hypothetical protein
MPIAEEPPVPITGLTYGTTQSADELHITGGHRAVSQSRGHWVWTTTITPGGIAPLKPLPIQGVDALAKTLGAELFGGDSLSGFETKLISRVWTPLDGPNNGVLQPADLWAAIGGNAERAGDEGYGRLARNVAFSLHAAGIRLRDASDHYQDQLAAAIEEERKPGTRFSNIQMTDLQLAFHSVLSELASARDYLAAIFARHEGAPPKVDAMNRLQDWLSASSRADLRAKPIFSEMLKANDPASEDPWLCQLTEYRNQVLHRNPMGAASGARWLRYDVRDAHEIQFPFIEFPLGDDDSSAPGKDALLRFVELYRKMTALLKTATDHAAFPPKTPHFIAT